MQDDQDQISKLLRLKRFEQPEPEYFDKFLEEFKVRQRSQMLRDPAWRIAWDRLCAFFGEQFPARLGYGLASTAVLAAAGIASMDILNSRPMEFAASSPLQRPSSSSQTASLNLNGQVQLPELPSLDSRTAHTVSYSAPRYIMDARPVSYEPPSSF